MKKINKFFLVFLLILLSPIFVSAEECFTISNYKVDIKVNEKNSYLITEIIDIEFNQPRHGIFRFIPSRFDKGWVEISDVFVQGFNYTTDLDSERMLIKIGSDDKYVEGHQRYAISYRYDVGADNLPDMDEFNHNIVGLDWDTTIASVEFTIHMPKPFETSNVNCVSGKLGSSNNKNVAWSVSGNTITGKSLGILYNHEALTVVLPLPKGYWVGAVKHEKPFKFPELGKKIYKEVTIKGKKLFKWLYCTWSGKYNEKESLIQHKYFSCTDNIDIVECWHEYDSKGNMFHTKCSDGDEYWSEYDTKGNLIHQETSSGTEYWYEYDSKGHLIKEKWSSGCEKLYEYDSAGKCIHEKSSDGFEYWYEYDKAGNLIHEESIFDIDKKSITEYWYEYNSNGNKIHTKYSNGTEYWYEYNGKGNLIHSKSNYGEETFFEYIYREDGSLKCIMKYQNRL